MVDLFRQRAGEVVSRQSRHDRLQAKPASGNDLPMSKKIVQVMDPRKGRLSRIARMNHDALQPSGDEAEIDILRGKVLLAYEVASNEFVHLLANDEIVGKETDRDLGLGNTEAGHQPVREVDAARLGHGVEEY